jgi:PKD repeat protein
MEQTIDNNELSGLTATATSQRSAFLFFPLPHFLKTILLPTHIWHIWFCPTAQADPSQNQKSQIFPSSVWLLCILTSLFSIDSFAQIKTPQTPQFENQQPQTPTHTFSHNGTFNVCLYIYRIANGDTSCRSSRCYNITVTNLTNSCVASFTYGVNHLQRRLEVNSTATGSNLIYRWSFGDDSTSNLLHPANHIYTHNGVYRVCLLVINALDTNCRNEYCRFINVNYHDSNIVHSEIQADFAKNTINPSNNTIQFVNASSGAINYSWAFGDGYSSTDENPLHSFETNEFYMVCLTASGPNGIDVFCNSVSSDNSTTKIANVNTFEMLRVYPNPFNESVNIDLSVKTNISITFQITDISRKTMEIKKIDLPPGNNNIKFETSHLNNGMYLLTILGEGLNKTFKVIK